jgi:protein-disulfide isomerase
MFSIRRVTLIGFVLIFQLSCATTSKSVNKTPTGKQKTPETVAQADSDTIPVGDSPVLGPKDAPITIVAFMDFQCPFCAKSNKTLQKIRDEYDGKVRIVFKHLPLSFHKKAKPAARAALAAGEQGKFWEMRRKLFENRDKFKDKDMKAFTASLAKKIGLDVKRYKKDFAKSKYDKVIKRDKKLARTLKAKGTPHFFINGTRIKGAQPYGRFKDEIQKQLKLVDKLKQQGVETTQLYPKLVDNNYEKPETKQKDKKKDKSRTVKHVPVKADDPVTGNTENPLVTIVQFSEFECPFCKKAKPSIDKLMKNHGDEIRLVHKHLPLHFHKEAKPAARAAIAAQQQGQFWKMYDLLFDHQAKLGQDGLYEKLAEKADLNLSQFREALQSSETDDKLARDRKLAEQAGVKGTPNFFINGVQVTGAQPYVKFKKLVEKQIDKAKALRNKKDLSGDKLYKAIVKQNQKAYDSPQKAQKEKKDEKPDRQRVDLQKLNPDQGPSIGSEEAPITIVAFIDLQCPFCQKTEPILDRITDEYGKQNIRIVFKHYPLPFHNEAKPAARAVMAAKKQGKF